jgi:hypothetical protein
MQLPETIENRRGFGSHTSTGSINEGLWQLITLWREGVDLTLRPRAGPAFALLVSAANRFPVV